MPTGASAFSGSRGRGVPSCTPSPRPPIASLGQQRRSGDSPKDIRSPRRTTGYHARHSRDLPRSISASPRRRTSRAGRWPAGIHDTTLLLRGITTIRFRESCLLGNSTESGERGAKLRCGSPPPGTGDVHPGPSVFLRKLLCPPIRLKITPRFLYRTGAPCSAAENHRNA